MMNLTNKKQLLAFKHEGFWQCMDTLEINSFLKNFGKIKKIMVNLKLFKNVYKGKKVLITGHTGFQGTWLCLWLLLLGAEVAGFSNKKKTKPSLFEILNLKKKSNLMKVTFPMYVRLKNN